MAQQFNFKRLEEPFEADWPVTVNVPVDGGKTIEEEFHARFRIVRQMEQLQDPEPSTPEAEPPVAAEDGASPPDAVQEAFRIFRGNTIKEWRRWFVGFAKPTSDANELTDDVLWNIITTPYSRNAVEAAYKAFASGVAAKN